MTDHADQALAWDAFVWVFENKLSKATYAQDRNTLKNYIEIGKLHAQLSRVRALNDELLTALKAALPIVEDAEQDMETQGERADDPVAPTIRAAIAKTEER